jgi:peroxiredoxin Q/BCP
MFNLLNGDIAPEIELVDVRGKPWKLSDYRGKMVCIHFCRGEYCPTTRGEFSLWDCFSHIFTKMNCELVFVVNGGRAEHARFVESHRIRPPLLIDQDGAVGTAYGVYGVNHNDTRGEDYRNYVAPAVYLIDAEGKVACFWILSGPRGRPSPECLLGVLAYAEHNGWKY